MNPGSRLFAKTLVAVATLGLAVSPACSNNAPSASGPDAPSAADGVTNPPPPATEPGSAGVVSVPPPTIAPAPLRVPDEWLRVAPGPREAEMLVAEADKRGWSAMAPVLRASALRAYERGNLAAAEAWRDVARWAALWGEPAGEHAERWRAAMRAAGWTVSDNARQPLAPATPLGAWMERDFRVWVLARQEFSEAFFALENVLDFKPEVFRILSGLRARNPRDFEDYAPLALAIALVQDMPPPAHWPHWQVTPEALRRALPEPAETFAYFVEMDRARESLQPLARLGADELRFLVDLALPDAERRWARAKVKQPLTRLEETYTAVYYRRDRIAEDVYVWPGKTYRLDEILAEGGICVDQAYFATQAGKARGVPTLLFAGAGRDGRHAWFGFLGAGGKWRMDAGRYTDQRYVTGEALDPQTWLPISDHELSFLSEGFRAQKSARQAATHAGFAALLLADGRPADAERAARAAVRLERRTLAGWDVLLALQPGQGKEREAIAHEAASVLTAYPDLKARYLGVVIASLRSRGEVARADFLERELTRNFRETRMDLSVKQIAGQLARARETEPMAAQIQLYNRLLRQFGRGSGATMWDEVVRPFAVRLAQENRLEDARTALRVARTEMNIAASSAMGREMEQFEAQLKIVGSVAPVTPAPTSP